MLNNKKLIIIDAGHGGKDPGACNHAYKLKEKDITLKVAMSMKPKLIALGYVVKLTREMDIYMSPTEKGKFPNRFDSDFCLSIHCNASIDKKSSGHEDFYYCVVDKNTKKVTISSKGLKAATAINNAWMDSFPNVINRKVKGANFALLRLPDCVSVLTELDFISNDNWCKSYIQSPSMVELMAATLTTGINNYFRL